MKVLLIVMFASANWGSNSVYKTEYPDLLACNTQLSAMRIEQPDGTKSGVTVTAFCTPDTAGLKGGYRQN